MTEQREVLLAPRKLLYSALGALAGATVLSVLVVLPVELRYDPTGFGRATGLLRTPDKPVAGAHVAEHATSDVAQTSTRPFRSDVVDIPLALGAELEYKVLADAGAVFVYSWSIVGPGKVYFEFHGESEPAPEVRVQSYLTRDGAHEESGSLRAPFAGIHGWYLLNDSETPIVIRLRLSGFYQLSPQFAAVGIARAP